MNRQALADATNLHDAAVPIYLMQEIANGTKASERDAEKTADFLLGRLAKTNLIVKLKALQIISFCIREGDPVFAEVIREEEGEITAYLQYSGPPDPVMGDERYRRIRVASQEVLVCLNDGCLPRRNEPAPSNGGPWGSSSPAQQPHQHQQQTGQYGNSQAAYNQPGAYNQSGGYGVAQASQPSGPWGGNSSASGSSRPAPYSDSPGGPSYGGQNSYGGPHRGDEQQNTAYGGGGGYGNESNPQQHQPHQSHQPSGLSSWSTPAPSAPSYGAPKATGGGMWSSSGYQKTAPPPPSYNHGGSSFSSRDNRPTVLVGHNLSFPKPVSHGNSSLIGGVSGTSSGTYGGPTGGGGYGGATGGAFGGQSSSGFAPSNTGPGFGGSSGGFGGSSGAYGGNGGVNTGGFGGTSSRQTPSYIENMNRMLSNPSGGFSGGGMHGGGGGGVNTGPSTKIGKAVVGLKKIGVEAKDRWDRRNMDKSIGASLADHDELSAGPAVMDRGYYQPQSLQQGTGGKDTTGEYERGLIDSLCASVGLARAPPADALKRFVDLAQTLDVQTIGDILLDKLEDSVWQVRLKALHVVLALLESPGSAPYMELFEDNAGVLEELRGDAKPTVAQKAQQVMRVLGLLDESTPEPPKRPTTRGTPTRSAPQQGGGEVDFLGFEGLSISSSSQQTQAPPHVYSTPPPATRKAPPAQEVSLLDGFDPVPMHPNAQHHQHQYQPQGITSPQQHQPQQYGDLLHNAQHQQEQYPQHGATSPQQHVQQQYGDLLLQSPQRQASPVQFAGDDRSKTLSSFGKDLFTIANSPRNSGSGEAPVSGERSAFNFM